MPTCRRKRVLLTEPSPVLLQALKADPNREVYYLARTGEIFDSYDTYAARMSFYRLKQFQCEVTGKSGLDYFQALESEQMEARTMHSRFPEQLKPAILKAVQWQVMGRLDHLVEAVYDRYKDRYFRDEKIYVDIQGDKFLARVVEVFPPRVNSSMAVDDHRPVASTSALPPPNASRPVHMIGGDLKVPAKEVNAADDPVKYLYKVQILEEEKSDGRDKHPASAKELRAKWSGSLMDVQCAVMSRDRLAFSKSILRRFIRDCVDRDAAVASPWTVKPPVATRYGVDSVMPEATRQGVEDIKKGEIQKRKKVWEDKEGPLKKPKKMTPAQEERDLPLIHHFTAKAAAVVAEKRDREARDKAEKQQHAKAEADRAAADKKKNKPIRYPTEDLDVVLTEKEKKGGMKIRRPTASRDLPWNDREGTFEAFLMSWNYLVVYGEPLHISSFTLDEYEHALRHSLIEPPCVLLAEVHACLIYNLRTIPFQRHSAVVSLMRLQEELETDDPELGVTIEQLITSMADVGNNWERHPLRSNEGRNGWEESLVGCLKDHATLETFPPLRRILTRLLFSPDAPVDPTGSSSDSRTSTPAAIHYTQPTAPGEAYHALPAEDRIAILSFMCNISVSSKAIHAHMETSEENLTALRKDKIAQNRARKQCIEERDALLGDAKNAVHAENGVEDDTPMNDLSDLSDISASEGGSESGSGKPSKSKDLRRKAQSQAHAKQRELARQKTATAKQAIAEHRRLDEEVGRLERRLAAIERDFRKLLGSIRVKPMGRDRFYNRIWWFDGMGSMSLLGSGGIVQYGSGRLFIQGPSSIDMELLDRREETYMRQRRLDEEGEDGMLGEGEWAVYSDIEEIDEFAAWLNPKGHRELALKNALTKWWPNMAPGIRKRLTDSNNVTQAPEARRSTRVKHSGADISRYPYMTWTNRRATNPPWS
ncbi:chromatin remodeling complex protein [Auriscalpium vulgare]|uniref:Chromatin remodeling complex protein n=1 Tax=Auriscalpium vulgare TaxID=40419 RepID=A0ACB8SBL0_9AGAM|nr:chromatin remodeling complex protein [Auriscalpium vulgare]